MIEDYRKYPTLLFNLTVLIYCYRMAVCFLFSLFEVVKIDQGTETALEGFGRVSDGKYI